MQYQRNRIYSFGLKILFFVYIGNIVLFSKMLFEKNVYKNLPKKNFWETK